MANINVKLKNAAGDILYPQTEWSNIQNKPSVFVAQNASTSGGTIATENSNVSLDNTFYEIYTPRSGGRSQIALQYESGLFLVLQTDGSWVKKDIDELQMSGNLGKLTCASHSHIIRGTFK